MRQEIWEKEIKTVFNPILGGGYFMFVGCNGKGVKITLNREIKGTN